MTRLRFSGSHVWVRVDGTEAVLGLSDYLQDQMGEITTLELPDPGDVLHANKRMGHVESEEASPLWTRRSRVRCSRSTLRRSRILICSTASRTAPDGCFVSASRTPASSRS